MYGGQRTTSDVDGDVRDTYDVRRRAKVQLRRSTTDIRRTNDDGDIRKTTDIQRTYVRTYDVRTYHDGRLWTTYGDGRRRTYQRTSYDVPT